MATGIMKEFLRALLGVPFSFPVIVESHPLWLALKRSINMKLTTKQTIMISNSGLSVGLLLCLLVIFGLILSSCSRENVHGSGRMVTEERAVARFEDITLEGPLQVHLEQDQRVPVVIEAEDNVMRFVETFVNGTTLHVKIRNNVNLKSFRPINVYVQNDQFRRIIFSGSGSLTANDTITSTLFSYEINGSADARLKLDANEVELIVNGSGDMEIEGRTGDYRAEVNGSGDIDAIGLQAENARIRISGSGEQRIWVLDLLDARITGSGNIRYKGTPGTVNTSINGSGKVIKL